MLIGAVFPQTEIGSDPAAIRDWAQAVESLGYDHIAAFDHVLGANRASRPGWKGMYDHTHPFHEPLVLFGYLAACTQRIGLATSILVLPQREAAAVAKQAAEVDVLTGGRLRLGVAAGWNDVEFDALGRSFANRGQRIGEQVEVMRFLWTQELVTFRGKWHSLVNVGINPLPVQRPIPVWFGGGADMVLRRVAHSGDGWFANTSGRTAAYTGVAPFAPDDTGRDTLRRLHAYARGAGRDPSRIGVEVRVEMVGRSPEDAAVDSAKWSAIGVTHAQFTTMRAGLRSPADHITALRRFIQAARHTSA